jgi:hypothetical protein
MNCEQVKKMLSSFADDELDASETEAVTRHLNSCQDCRPFLDNLKSMPGHLALIRQIPLNTSVADRVLARVKAKQTGRHSRLRVLRPVIAGVAAVMTILVLVMVFALPSQSPSNRLSAALANTRTLHSLRMSQTGYEYSPATGEWISTYDGLNEYNSPGQLHIQSTSHPTVTDRQAWQTGNLIITDNTVYVDRNFASPFSVLPDRIYSSLVNGGYDRLGDGIQEPTEFLKKAAFLKQQTDEYIDGVLCTHYHGEVNMDIYIQEILKDAQKLAEERNLPWNENRIKSIENEYRRKLIAYEFWIGKSDEIIHQWQVFDGPTPDRVRNEKAYKTVIRYYDFNAEIVIKAPLDDEGNLLPDWIIWKQL